MNEIAATFLVLMPFAIAAKTLVFAVITLILWRQDTHTDLGEHIVAQNGWLAMTSLGFTLLFAALAWRFHTSSGLAWWLPLMVAIEWSAAMVTYHSLQMVRIQGRVP